MFSELDHHSTLAALLDQIEAAATGKRRASAGADLQRLRQELTRHIDGERWLGGAPGARSARLLRLYESGAVIRRRLFELREALHAADALQAGTCASDLREMIATHLALENEAARALETASFKRTLA